MADKKPAKPALPHGFDKKPEKKSPPPAPSGNLGAEILVGLLLVAVGFPLLGAVVSPDFRGAMSETLATPLAYVKTIATVVSMIAITIAVYAFLRITEISRRATAKLGLSLSWENEKTAKNVRWERVENYMRSENSSDWKIAVLEADNILDEVVERMGYKGETLGERMKMIEASDFPHLDLAWKAHKVRNEIAHKGGPDFVLSRSVAEETVNMYHRIFKELGYL